MSAPGQQTRGQHQTVRYIDYVGVVPDDLNGLAPNQQWQAFQQDRMAALQLTQAQPSLRTALGLAHAAKMSDTSYIQSISDFEDGNLNEAFIAPFSSTPLPVAASSSSATSSALSSAISSAVSSALHLPQVDGICANPAGFMSAEAIPFWQIREDSPRSGLSDNPVTTTNFERGLQRPNVATLGASSSTLSLGQFPGLQDQSLNFNEASVTPIGGGGGGAMPPRPDSSNMMFDFSPSEPLATTSTVQPSTLAESSCQGTHQYAPALFPNLNTGLVGAGQYLGKAETSFNSSFSAEGSGVSPSSLMAPNQLQNREQKVIQTLSNPPLRIDPNGTYNQPVAENGTAFFVRLQENANARLATSLAAGHRLLPTTSDHTADDWFHRETAPVPSTQTTNGGSGQFGDLARTAAHLVTLNSTAPPAAPFTGSGFSGPLRHNAPTPKSALLTASNHFKREAVLALPAPLGSMAPPPAPTPQRPFIDMLQQITSNDSIAEKTRTRLPSSGSLNALQETPGRGRPRTRAPQARSASVAAVAPPRSRSRQDVDEYIIRSKSAGLTYREIKIHGELDCAESTIRGRFRNLTKAPNQRLRKPLWTDIDVTLLKDEVLRQTRQAGRAIVHPERISWKGVADYIRENGGSYHFGNATCKRKWVDLVRQRFANPYLAASNENTPSTDLSYSSSGQAVVQAADQPSENTLPQGEEHLQSEESTYD